MVTMSNDFASQMILQKCIKPFINFLNIEMHTDVEDVLVQARPSLPASQ